MRIQHNLLAMNANRNIKINTGIFANTTEKLASGYKINRAADDAAGLAISKKMRRQIRGLTRASNNCQDGISMVQTAEGALNEVHNMLQRMNQLAVQSANGTNTAAESQIRDADMATLMVKYSNNNIIMQAAQAMLAQANQASNGVLQLLQ